MLEIKHTLCPTCSVGCWVNIVLKEGEVVGTFPYKRHPVNAGKNCLGGRTSIDCYLNKFTDINVDNTIADALKELKSTDASNVTVICSGNNDVDEVKAIKEFADAKNFNLGFYADNLKEFADVATYDEVEEASNVIVIGDLLFENPLIGRRIVHAKQNGAKISALGKTEESVTFNIADETLTLLLLNS